MMHCVVRFARIALALAVASVAGCSAKADAPSRPQAPHPSAHAAADAPAELREAYFAGGCFWGVEHFMQQIDGVVEVESGYMGGHVDSPSYEDVASQTSGHLESVRVTYDPARVDYQSIAKRFFEIHDPTQADGQGVDIGPEYHSAVFYGNEHEKDVAAELIARLRARGYDVVTELRPVEHFWPAEAYHQDYYARTGRTPYCHGRVNRFGD